MKYNQKVSFFALIYFKYGNLSTANNKKFLFLFNACKGIRFNFTYLAYLGCLTTNLAKVISDSNRLAA